MKIGVIVDHILLKYGIIKEDENLYFFHHSELGESCKKNTVVYFDSNENQATNINALNINDIETKLLSTNNLIKWFAIKFDEKIYKHQLENYLLNAKNTFLLQQEKELNSHLLRFTNTDFLKTYQIILKSFFVSIGGKDWTSAIREYKLVCKFLGEHQYHIGNEYFNFNFSYNDFNQNRILIANDEYITSLLFYEENIDQIDYFKHRDGKYDKKKLEEAEIRAEDIKIKLIQNFNKQYDKSEHYKRISKFFLQPFPQSYYKANFDQIINAGIYEFLENSNISEIRRNYLKYLR